MNGNPHVHEIKVTRQYPSLEEGNWYVKYGDTRVRLGGFWIGEPPTWSAAKYEREVEKAAHKAIAIHDAGSKAAVDEKTALARINQRLVPQDKLITVDNYTYRQAPQVWASELGIVKET